MAAPITGPSGAITSNGAAVAGKKWSLTAKGNNKDVSNFVNGRYRIAGLPDAEGTIEIPLIDPAAPPYNPGVSNPNLVPGAVVALSLKMDSGHTFPLTAIIDEVNPSQDIENNATYEVKFSLQSGSLTYPVIP
jgi:hypothetical protein